MIVAAIIQARLGSTRLPGKVLRRVGHQTILTHVLARAKRIPGVDVIMVATTTEPRDDAIVALCRGAGVRWCRGPERDVLARYLLAAETAHADVIIRLTSDCPLLDPAVAGEVVRLLREPPECDYASNVHAPSWPDGCDVEAFTRAALERAGRDAGADEREHVTTHLWRSERFSVRNLALSCGEDYSALKLSVDSAADLARVRRVYAHLQPRDAFGWRDTLRAHAEAFPTRLHDRSRRIFGTAPKCADRRAAYEIGAAAAAARHASDLNDAVPNPYSTHQEPLRVAWMLGWEDVADLGRRELASG